MHFQPIQTFIVITCSLLTAISTHAAVVYQNGFETMPLGPNVDSDIKSNWNTRYTIGPDEGRVSTVTDSNSGRALKVMYPAYANTSNPSGATWETDLEVSAEELYLSYWVKFDSNFDFVKGGKMPGLAGSTSFPYGDNEFSTRLMWRENGKLEFYLHGYKVHNTADYSGDPANAGEPYRVFWDDAGYHAKLVKGQWHHIEIRQKLNTPGQRDGRLQGWLDGVLVCDDSDNSGVRASGESNTKLNHVFFSTFFGGSSAPVTQWQPTVDVFAIYDDFTIATSYIGTDDTPDGSAPPPTGGSSGSTSSSGGYSGDFDLPTKIEAENYNNANDSNSGNSGNTNGDCIYYGLNVDVQDSSDDGTCNVGWTASGETLDYDIDDAGGTYDIRLRVSANSAGKRIQVLSNGSSLGTVTVNNTGWSGWHNKTLSGKSIPSNSKLTVKFLDGGVNLNYINIVSSSGSSASSTSSSGAGGCINYTYDSGLKELTLPSSSGGCVDIVGGNLQSSNNIAIADSDANTSCDLRGTATGSGGGSHTINGNWETPSSLSGNILNINVTNGCPHFKLRVMAP